MPLIKVLGRKACPVMKEIMWNISLNPSHWLFLWLLRVICPCRILQKIAHDVARLGKRRVAQEPWVSWCHFLLVVLVDSLHRFVKAPINSWAEKDETLPISVFFTKGLGLGAFSRNTAFPIRRWPECTRYLRVGGNCKTVLSLLHECCCQHDESRAPLCRNVFCSPAS